MISIDPSQPVPEQKHSLRGAAAALQGFDYQLDVSILAALQLLLVSKAADRLILEPANDEDLEADLVDWVPGRMQPSAAMAGNYKLVIQVKRSAGEPWSIEDFKKLLEHGSEKPGGRRKALHHLDDPDTRYLLVMSADAKGVARDLLVEGFEEASDKAGFPRGLRSTLKKSPEGRVAIWGKLTPQQLASSIREKFSDVLHVPRVEQENLLEALRLEAKSRTRSATPGIWTREDLLAVVRKFGGFLSSSADLDRFVPPENFGEMTAKLAKFGAVVIRGPSGTGKTEAARKLCDWARTRDGTLEIVTLGSADTPSATRKLVNNGPTLFYVDDPWGQYSLSGGAEAWTEQLPRLLGKANAHHQFVVTSRSDMMKGGKVKESLDLWAVDLDSEHYANGQLAEIYDRRMDPLSPALQAKAYSFRTAILDKLTTPLEIDILFQHLQRGARENEADPAFLQRLLKIAHREAVADVVVKALDSEGSCRSGAALWALLAARGQLDRGMLVALQRVLRRHDRELADALETLLDRMVAARFLRQPARTIAFAHPSVREGFEAYARANWWRSEAAIELLVSALTQLPEAYMNWGMEAAARITELARGFAAALDSAEPFQIAPESQIAIDAWFDRSLVAKEADFLPLLELASEVASEGSISGRVANWLLKGVQRGAAYFIQDWSPPEYDDAWYEAVSGHPFAVQVADRFVRDVLAFDRGSYGADFVARLDRIAPDLTSAYIAAAIKMVGNGFEMNADTIAAGAVRNLRGFEAVVHAALDDLARDYRRYVEQESAEWRAVEDGERDAAAEEAMRWNHEGDGYTSGVFIGAYIRALRRSGDWQAVAGHVRVKEMIRSWSNAIVTSSTPVGLDELRALITEAKDHRDESDAWAAVRQRWQAGLASDLEARLHQPAPDPALRGELALCSLAHSLACLSAAFDNFSAAPDRQIALLADVHRVLHRLDAEERQEACDQIMAQLPSDFREILAAMPEKDREASPASPAAMAILTGEAGKLDSETLACVVPVIIASDGDVSVAVRHWLERASSADDALKAAEAAVAIDIPALVRLALKHQRADARRQALLHLAAPLPAPLPPEILGFAKDPSNRVRRALVSLLKDKPHPQHLDILVALMADTWSSAEPQYEESDSYDVAQEAVIAMAAYAALSDPVGKLLLNRADKTPDRRLSQYALIVAANCCSEAIQHDIWNLVNLREARWVRLDALDALADADAIDPSIVALISPPYIFSSPVILAVSAIRLLGKHAPYADVQRIFTEVASANSWRALLLVGVVALAERDDARARLMLDLLEPGHPARQILDSGDPLPSTILDDLGDVLVRERVRDRLGDRIALRKKHP